jgi:hypothetical protein
MAIQKVCYPCGAPVVSMDRKCAYCQTEYTGEVSIRWGGSLVIDNPQSAWTQQQYQAASQAQAQWSYEQARLQQQYSGIGLTGIFGSMF